MLPSPQMGLAFAKKHQRNTSPQSKGVDGVSRRKFSPFLTLRSLRSLRSSAVIEFVSHEAQSDAELRRSKCADAGEHHPHRIGQQRPVTVYRLVTQGSIEEKIVRLHRSKRDLAEGILSGQDTAAPIDAGQLMDLLRAQ